METISVKASKNYDVTVSRGILAECGRYAKELFQSGSVVIVSDDNVFPLYGETVIKSLEAEGFTVHSFVIPHGEKSKCMGVYNELLEFLYKKRLTRSDILVTLGGGVVGDLTGFAAATYQRGVKFMQIPTTLLAMVDSSVGGKTAVNLEHGKNQVGCFYQPSAVLCDPDVLATLPEEEFLCGCAEVIKYAVLFDRQFFYSLKNTKAENQLENVITTCVKMKRDIVADDEFDTGKRMLLNLGHTVGHAVEACSDFTILHGQGVAVGTAVITRSAAKRGYIEKGEADEIISLIKSCGLPDNTEFLPEDLYRAALSDKKASGDNITLVVPKSIGKCELVKIKKTELLDWIKDGVI